MPVYFDYALKVSIALAVVFLFYALLLKRMTYYRWNRYFLLMFSLFSFIVPFTNVNVFVQAQQGNAVAFVNAIPSIHSFEVTREDSNQGMAIYWQILSAVFLIVSFALLLRLLIQLLSIRKIQSKSTLLAGGEEKIYHISESILPFSFLNNIFINASNYNDKELQDILAHERVHVHEQHSADMLVSEIICILNWYNPFAWMIKNAIRENLEFIADDAVIRKGADKKHYQYLLLKVTGSLPSAVASSFKFSTLKSRIMMMNKKKTSGLHLLKFGLLIPIITLVLLAFRDRKESNQTNTTTVKSSAGETYILTNLTYSIPNEKAKEIVFKEKDKSLLKAGDVLNLKQISNEKDRLKSLLERNGYNKLKSNAIMFWIDTASVKNSFTVEIKIDVEPKATAFIFSRNSSFLNNQLITANKLNLGLIKKPRLEAVSVFMEATFYAHSLNNKSSSFS